MQFKKVVAQAAAILILGAGSSASESWAQGSGGPTPRLIVRWKQAATQALAVRAMNDVAARFGVSLKPARKLVAGAELLQLDKGMARKDLQQLIASLSRDPMVEYAIEDALLQPAFTPNDPEYSQQWQYFDSVAGLNLPAAWDFSTGAGVTIAVLDSGFRPHRDLAPSVIGGYDFISDTFVANDGTGRDASALDPGDGTDSDACGPGSRFTESTWHGTHVSGILAAVTNNGSGVAGVAYDAKIVPVRVLGRCGALLSDVAEAAVWAAGGTVAGVPANPNPAKLLNLSLSAPFPCNPFAQGAIDKVRSLGAVIVTAAGNDNSDARNSLPANCEGVIVVAALARDGNKAPYSNFGSIVDVAAPGGVLSSKVNAVLSTGNSGTGSPGSDTLSYKQGTSMATAHVAGVAALMLARNTSLSPLKIEDFLKVLRARFPPTRAAQAGAAAVS